MKLVEFLQGKWLGHPLHAALVHVPVGGWLFACAVDLCAVWGGGSAAPIARSLALWSVGAGLVAVLAAVPTGVADWTAIKKGKPAWTLALYHMLLNVAATGVWAVNFWLRWKSAGPPSSPVVVTSIIGALLVIVSAYLGSRMVFDHGIGVARMSKKKWRAIAEHGGANVPQEK